MHQQSRLGVLKTLFSPALVFNMRPSRSRNM